MRSLVLLLIYLAISAPVALAGNKCYALVLEAGGDLGAYEAGVIQGLVNNLPAEEVQWDVISGVSIGAINGAAIAQYPKGQEKEMSAWLTKMWEGVSKNDVYKNYPGGIIQGLLYEEGVFDTTPAYNFLMSKVTRPLVRKVALGSTDMKSGEFFRFTEKYTDADIIESIMCSSAVPMLFPYRNFQNTHYIDGGVVIMTDIPGAI